MSNYYDPYSQARQFSLYAGLRAQERKEADEQESDQRRRIQSGVGLLKMAEAKRSSDMADARLLLMQRDPDSVTGFKYKPKEIEKTKSPLGWLKNRYATPGSERVELEKGVWDQELTDILSDPDTRHGKFDPVKHQKKMQMERDQRMFKSREADVLKNKGNKTPDDKDLGITAYNQKLRDSGLDPKDYNYFDDATDKALDISIKRADIDLGEISKVPVPKPNVPGEEVGEGISGKVVDFLKTGYNKENQTGIIGDIGESIGKGVKGAKDVIASAFKADEAIDMASKAKDVATTAKTVTDATSIADEALLVKDAGTLTPGIGEAVALKNVYDVWGQSGVQGEDKIAATAETGADLASSYAIASANPFAMAAGGAYKAGKFLWDIYAK
tara:strand:+ start:43 stop:1200 length:1158 start_codon:yes stop_codon:yes gene_type:complete